VDATKRAEQAEINDTACALVCSGKQQNQVNDRGAALWPGSSTVVNGPLGCCCETYQTVPSSADPPSTAGNTNTTNPPGIPIAGVSYTYTIGAKAGVAVLFLKSKDAGPWQDKRNTYCTCRPCGRPSASGSTKWYARAQAGSVTKQSATSLPTAAGTTPQLHRKQNTLARQWWSGWLQRPFS
jgi:hypothetical protein